MKRENGITLTALVMYVVVMIILLGVMGSVITIFYDNINEVRGNVQEIVSFNKFNSNFLKEVKLNNNKVEKVEDNYILFSSGNSFSIFANTIYYNNIKICDKVQSLQFTLEQDTEDLENEYSIIKVRLKFENFDKSIRYKLENIY